MGDYETENTEEPEERPAVVRVTRAAMTETLKDMEEAIARAAGAYASLEKSLAVGNGLTNNDLGRTLMDVLHLQTTCLLGVAALLQHQVNMKDMLNED